MNIDAKIDKLIKAFSNVHIGINVANSQLESIENRINKIESKLDEVIAQMVDDGK